jgi:long-chain acyl-CoA synthetase
VTSPSNQPEGGASAAGPAATGSASSAGAPPPSAGGSVADPHQTPLTGNVADLVAAAARRGPDHPALREPANDLTLTWSELDAAVTAEAARLVGAGVRPGGRVLIRLGHGARFCVTLFGALRAGAVAVPVGTQSPERELGIIVADCQPTVLVAEPGDPAVAATAGTAPVLGPPELRSSPWGGAEAVGGGSAGAGPADGSPADGGSVGGGSADGSPVGGGSVGGGEDIAVLGYTSGTTGRPRGVRLSHRALLANRAQIGQLRPVPVSPADRVLLQLPMFHLYGLGAGLLQVCWAGATGVLVDRVDPGGVLDAIRAERITVLAGVPSRYRSLLELPADRLREGLVSVRLCIAGGAPLPPDLLRAWTDATGLDLYEGYGLTETGPLLTSTLVGGRPKPGSVGQPLPGAPGVAGVELRLDDPSGDAETEPDEEDELDDGQPDTGLVAARGPNLFSGYWPDGAGGPDAEGWFRTSDVGFLDAEGDLHLVDRATDLVIVSGFNVYPHEVERVLTEHPAVAEAAVVGVPDPRTGEAVKAVLVLREGERLSAEQVREHCAERLARFKVPSIVEFTDELPRSATGKIARRALREEPPR